MMSRSRAEILGGVFPSLLKQPLSIRDVPLSPGESPPLPSSSVSYKSGSPRKCPISWHMMPVLLYSVETVYELTVFLPALMVPPRLPRLSCCGQMLSGEPPSLSLCPAVIMCTLSTYPSELLSKSEKSTAPVLIFTASRTASWSRTSLRSE